MSDPMGAPLLAFCAQERVSPNTMRKAIADGRVKAFRMGRNLMIEVASYREFIAKQQVEGIPEYKGTAKAIEARAAKRAAEKAEKQAAEKPHPTLEELGV